VTAKANHEHTAGAVLSVPEVIARCAASDPPSGEVTVLGFFLWNSTEAPMPAFNIGSLFGSEVPRGSTTWNRDDGMHVESRLPPDGPEPLRDGKWVLVHGTITCGRVQTSFSRPARLEMNIFPTSWELPPNPPKEPVPVPE